MVLCRREICLHELEELLNFLESHMSNETWPPEQVGAYFETQLPKLNHWRDSSSSRDNR